MDIRMLRRQSFRLIALVLAWALAAPYVPAQGISQASRLQLTVVQIGSVLVPGRPSRIMIRAQVTDAERRPVRRAIVVFVILASASGAGAVFSSGGTVETVTTNDEGIAQVTIDRATGGAGEFQIEVRASFESAKTEPQRVTVTNEVRAVVPTKWIVIGVAAAAAGAIGYAVSRNGTAPEIPSVTRIKEGPGRVR